MNVHLVARQRDDTLSAEKASRHHGRTQLFRNGRAHSRVIDEGIFLQFNTGCACHSKLASVLTQLQHAGARGLKFNPNATDAALPACSQPSHLPSPI
jgi:hypothetical protein